MNFIHKLSAFCQIETKPINVCYINSFFIGTGAFPQVCIVSSLINGVGKVGVPILSIFILSPCT